MPRWYRGYKAALGAVIASAWTDVPAKARFIALKAEKRNWTNLLDSGQMTTPWAVVEISPTPTDEWGTGAVRYAVGVTAYYIMPDGEEADGTIYDKLSDLEDAVKSAETLGTVLSEFEPNGNVDNPVNSSMLSADQPFSAGSLAFTCIVVPE